MVKLDLSIDEYNLLVFSLGTLQVQTARTLQAILEQAGPQINELIQKEQELQQQMMGAKHGHN